MDSGRDDTAVSPPGIISQQHTALKQGLTRMIALLLIGPVWVTTVANHCGTCDPIHSFTGGTGGRQHMPRHMRHVSIAHMSYGHATCARLVLPRPAPFHRTQSPICTQ
jgi:hypothetical protein